jgi:hypothetical protein
MVKQEEKRNFKKNFFLMLVNVSDKKSQLSTWQRSIGLEEAPTQTHLSFTEESNL